MKQAYFLILLMVLGADSSAQNLQTWVLASGGETFEISDRVVSWTLGEMVIETVTDANSNTLTQGFQQNKLITTGIDLPLEGYELNMYPNPASEFIWVELSGPLPGLILELRDMNGRLIQEKRDLSTRKLSISVNVLPTGFYLLRVANRDGLLIQSFKLLKNE